MGLKIFFGLAVVLLAAQNVLCTIWEFGEDLPITEVIFHDAGHMHEWEKVKHVQIITPRCFALQYVRVQVDNALSTPKTTYDKNTNVVTMEYQLWQNSYSSYDVVGKGINICNSNVKHFIIRFA